MRPYKSPPNLAYIIGCMFIVAGALGVAVGLMTPGYREMAKIAYLSIGGAAAGVGVSCLLVGAIINAIERQTVALDARMSTPMARPIAASQVTS